MKKSELKNRMRCGETLEEVIPHQRNGQSIIFKGQFDPFHPEEIIYVSEDAYDIAAYMDCCKSVNEDDVDEEEIDACIDDILVSCFSTQDFLTLTEKYVVANMANAVRCDLVAKELFDYVDWQSPLAVIWEMHWRAV